MPSVLEVMGSRIASTTMAATMPPAHADNQMTGAQARSFHRRRSPRSVARLPVPHRRLANEQYATIGP